MLHIEKTKISNEKFAARFGKAISGGFVKFAAHLGLGLTSFFFYLSYVPQTSKLTYSIGVIICLFSAAFVEIGTDKWLPISFREFFRKDDVKTRIDKGMAIGTFVLGFVFYCATLFTTFAIIDNVSDALTEDADNSKIISNIEKSSSLYEEAKTAFLEDYNTAKTDKETLLKTEDLRHKEEMESLERRIKAATKESDKAWLSRKKSKEVERKKNNVKKINGEYEAKVEEIDKKVSVLYVEKREKSEKLDSLYTATFKGENIKVQSKESTSKAYLFLLCLICALVVFFGGLINAAFEEGSGTEQMLVAYRTSLWDRIFGTLKIWLFDKIYDRTNLTMDKYKVAAPKIHPSNKAISNFAAAPTVNTPTTPLVNASTSNSNMPLATTRPAGFGRQEEINNLSPINNINTAAVPVAPTTPPPTPKPKNSVLEHKKKLIAEAIVRRGVHEMVNIDKAIKNMASYNSALRKGRGKPTQEGRLKYWGVIRDVLNVDTGSHMNIPVFVAEDWKDLPYEYFVE